MTSRIAPAAAQAYSPLYFLASVGAGGLTVTFFMWLMFWVPHPGKPVPVFEDIMAAFATGSTAMQGMIILAMAGIAVFFFLNIKALVWNLSHLRGFVRAEGFAAFRASNAETQMMAMPLALAMAVNGAFIAGLVFVPGLWTITEYLFPLAMIAFLAIGWMAFRHLGAFLGRVIGKGGFEHGANNSFAQKLPAFALAMVGVGMSAPAAMSTNPLTVGVSVVLSTFFLVSAGVIAVIALVMGIHAMMEKGVAPEAAPTLMIIIPILTVLGILMLRQDHGLHTTFEVHGSAGETLVMLSRILSVQVLFAIFGLFVLARIGYWSRFVVGRATSAGAYALVCPGVGLSVMMHFWLNKGLVAAGLVTKFGTAYWAISGLAVGVQLAMVALVFYLNRRHFRASPMPLAQPAE
ncbi:TsoY family (seleno)protein [Fluviibacterium sp. S390]|uniref:TsoY family (seleno)protein n=1 Tax=Fluviibacterium sp. S390 TaxID=3415139 RepID=UPI003C7E7CAE